MPFRRQTGTEPPDAGTCRRRLGAVRGPPSGHAPPCRRHPRHRTKSSPGRRTPAQCRSGAAPVTTSPNPSRSEGLKCLARLAGGGPACVWGMPGFRIPRLRPPFGGRVVLAPFRCCWREGRERANKGRCAHHVITPPNRQIAPPPVPAPSSSPFPACRAGSRSPSECA